MNNNELYELTALYEHLQIVLWQACYVATVDKTQWIKDQLKDIFAVYVDTVDKLANAGAAYDPSIIQ